jgi:hypothetical protein
MVSLRARLVETHISHSFDFALGGNAAGIQVSGWSVAESQHTWSVGRGCVVAIDNIVAPHGFFLEVDWHPFISYPHRPDQAVAITVLGRQLDPYRLMEREVAAFFCPAPRRTDKKLLIAFETPNSARISDYLETNDPREVAVAFRRLRILPLKAPYPSRCKNTASNRLKLEAGQVLAPQVAGFATVDLPQLLSQFEMLAGNCDLGLAMRSLGHEQLSLLRFGGATVGGAIAGLENDFANLGEQISAEIANNPIKEWMVRDASGLRFHTHQSSDAISEAEILRRQRLHLGFLRRKFLEDVELGEKIFVFAAHTRPRTYESTLALFLALTRRGRNRMLWVCPNFGEMEAGRVDEIVPGLARGSLGIFDGPLVAGHIATLGWLNVLFNAASVLDPSHKGW